jgi:voltage-gated potassium channel
MSEPSNVDHYAVGTWRHTVREIIFGSDTPLGKLFDMVLIIAIGLSVLAVLLESVTSIREGYGSTLYVIEWGFTLVFTVEYILRLWSLKKPMRYAISFFGIVDLLAILPTYLSLFLPGAQYLLVIRTLRVLRVFRVLKLVKYVAESQILYRALRASRHKILVFMFVVFTLVIILGSMMYLVEGEENGFTSIPRSIYWAIVTLTTVGYGDIAPQTNFGQALASFVMILGYGIIAVPTGIVTVELSNAARLGVSGKACPSCSADGHDLDAVYCKFCGIQL